MSGETTANGNGKDWKTRGIDVLERQGLGAVFAILILYGLYTALPIAVQQVKEGYQELSKQNSEATQRLGTDLKAVADRFEKDQERDYKVYAEVRETSEELRKKDAELERLREKLEEVKSK